MWDRQTSNQLQPDLQGLWWHFRNEQCHATSEDSIERAQRVDSRSPAAGLQTQENKSVGVWSDLQTCVYCTCPTYDLQHPKELPLSLHSRMLPWRLALKLTELASSRLLPSRSSFPLPLPFPSPSLTFFCSTLISRLIGFSVYQSVFLVGSKRN